MPPPAGEGEEVLQMVLRRRGLLDVEPTTPISVDGHDPMLLQDMDRAVAVLGAALRRGSRIAVYGDYDADGVTATAVLVRALRAAGADPFAYIPNREGEGYGLNLEALQDLAAQGAEVVVSVDCGTTAVEVAAQRPEGLALVITDHHLPRFDDGVLALPQVDALVNPQLPSDRYPFKGLSGAGVALKLVQALEAAGEVPPGTAVLQLPLVALGTVADLMPLVDENRVLVRHGLFSWSEAAPLGLLALARGAGVEGPPTSNDLGFSLGPRINAAGRMQDANLALACCLAQDPLEATRAAQALERLNRERRRALTAALEVAQPMAEELADDAPAIVIGHEAFHPGVVGLVAGRLTEEYQRPTFAYNRQGPEWRGSARGTDGLNVVDALGAASSALLRYGGHRGAGGFSIAGDEHQARLFRDRIEEAVAAQLGASPPSRTFEVDAVAQLADCHLRLADGLARLEPCGRGNPKVLLCARGCRVVRTEPLGRGPDHLRIVLRDRSGTAEAVAFNRPWLRGHLPEGRRVDVLFELEVDRWRGREHLRLLVRDLRPERDTELVGASAI